MKKTTLALTLASALGTSTLNAAIIDMDYSGLYTLLDQKGTALQNTSLPYYYDTTWGYGIRTQISGTLQFDDRTGLGSATINPFELLSAPTPAYTTSNFELKSIGGSLLLGNMNADWNGNNMTLQIVLDASGLFAELGSASVGDIFNSGTCVTSGACATPASNDVSRSRYPIGPVPIATSSFNTAGQTGAGTTIGQLSLGTDDSIGGSPFDDGVFLGFNTNIDFTSITVTRISSVPVPAAGWLFGTGLISLVGIARRRNTSSNR